MIYSQQYHTILFATEQTDGRRTQRPHCALVERHQWVSCMRAYGAWLTQCNHRQCIHSAALMSTAAGPGALTGGESCTTSSSGQQQQPVRLQQLAQRIDQQRCRSRRRARATVVSVGVVAQQGRIGQRLHAHTASAR
eukprot:TRINITY_DN1857_c0_g2_i2.p1 TRINITY_DN1857_c0_g2~~TRINITY_DN1857_c0_g2_i2.p1  ORF type:complete len:137 (-),score=6.91 TRINITY_DN1857_c0_g2_i2:633-1043(-)